MFLKHLQIQFDFVIQELPADIMCVDSLNIFRKLQVHPAITFKSPLITITAKESVNTQCQSTFEILGNPFQLINEKTPEKRKPESVGGVPGENNQPKCRKRLTFKLEDVYERVYGEKPEMSHVAEADVLALLLSAIATPVEFLNAVDIDAVPLANIKKCW